MWQFTATREESWRSGYLVVVSPQSRLVYSPNVDRLTARAVDAIWDQYPGYSADVFPKSELIPSVRENLSLAVRVLRRGAAPRADELGNGRVLGASRASQGVPLESVIQAYRSSERTIILDLFSDAQTWPVRLTSHYADLVISTFDLLTQEMIDAYRETAASVEAANRRVENELVRAVVDGETRTQDFDARVRTLGIDPRLPRVALAVGASAATDFALLHRLRRRIASVIQPHVVGPSVFGDIGELVVGIVSPRRGADAVAAAVERVVDEEGGGRIVVGIGRAVGDLPSAHSSSHEAIESAAAALRRSGGARVLRYSDALVDVLLGASPSISEVLVATRLDGLRGHPHLLETLEALIENDLSQSAAARSLFVHVNTVAHRVRRIHEITGYDPLKLDDLVGTALALRWASGDHARHARVRRSDT
jgi:sugar diacid utilization regulator